MQLTWDIGKFPNGVPNITFDVQGRKVYDPRSGTIAYSANAALCIADYLNNAQFGLVAQTKYPVTASMITNSGFSNFNAANLVDGDVTTNGFSNNTTNAASTITIDLGAGNPQEFRRFRMYLSSAGQVQRYDIQYSDDAISWTSVEEYFYILSTPPIGWSDTELAPNGAHRYWRINAVDTIAEAGFVNEIQFWKSDVDSVQLISAANTCDEAVNLLAGGTEPRFTINGSFETSEAPASVIASMNSVMSGSCLYVAGLWGIYPGIWRAPTISLSDSDLRVGFTVQTRLTHRDLYNGVQGTFISPAANWQATAYPSFQSLAYLAEDNNEPLWLTVQLPFTTSGSTAQRLSSIALQRVRRQITIQAQFKLTAYQVQPLDVIQFSHPRFGWVNKTFEVTACTLVYSGDSLGAPALGVDLTLREVDANIYAWSTANELPITALATTIMPQNSIASPVTGLGVSTVEVVRVADGVRASFVGLTWTAPTDAFVISGGHIRVQYKRHVDSLWLDGGKLDGGATSAQVGPVVDGTSYDVQIWAENTSLVRSSIVSATFTPTGTAVTLVTIADGSTRFARTGVHSSYRPLTNPLTAHDAGGGVATIPVASFTMRVGATDVSVTGSTIGSLLNGKLYFVYYDDAALAGGSVTMVATTTRETALQGAGRFLVGSVLTPVAGAPDTIGNNDGGTGAQIGAHFSRFATTYPANSGGVHGNAGAATDGNWGTEETWTNTAVNDPTSIFPIAGFGSPFDNFYPKNISVSLKAEVNGKVDTNYFGTAVVTVATMYSINGGASWTTLRSSTSTSISPAAPTLATLAVATDTFAVPDGTAPSNIVVKTDISVSGAGYAHGAALNATWFHGIYEASVTFDT